MTEPTPRQVELLRLVADGLAYAEIARKLWISIDTVKSHARRAYAAMGARNGAHAVAIAYRTGVLSVDGDAPSARPVTPQDAASGSGVGRDTTGPSDGVETRSGGCGCGHDGLDAMFHAGCPVAELSRAAGRLGYELVLDRRETP